MNHKGAMPKLCQNYWRSRLTSWFICDVRLPYATVRRGPPPNQLNFSGPWTDWHRIYPLDLNLNYLQVFICDLQVGMHDEIFHFEILKKSWKFFKYFKTPSLKYFMKVLIFIIKWLKTFKSMIKVTVLVKKSPPKIFWHFFPNGWEFFVQILHACYMFLPTIDYKFLFNYLQLWRSYAIL